ncbi:hypothetical protein TNCV_3965881 [Trichonephila clavipes]|nr:hypothetical protein TNCV_3965881 [Trichonephila clavipes]
MDWSTGAPQPPTSPYIAPAPHPPTHGGRKRRKKNFKTAIKTKTWEAFLEEKNFIVFRYALMVDASVDTFQRRKKMLLKTKAFFYVDS